MYSEIIAKMSLETKAELCSGKDFWHAQPAEAAGLESIMMTDGPHGLRKQSESADHLGINDSVPSTCFPSGAGICSSWNTDMARKLATALGEEAQQENVGIVLGPAINIKRTPLCGRNFEYMSEDPYLAGEMAVNYVQAMQAQGVGVSVKHFAANNQENRRMSINAVISPRALREIYLYPFEQAVKRADPWTLMCSYNRINGTYSCQNPWLLDDVLRRDWGFKGFVMSDWGAVDDRVESLKAGLELQMPADGGDGTKRIIAAVKDGSLDENVLDRAVERLLTIMLRAQNAHKPGYRYDVDAHHQLARDIATQTMVLLRNDGALPLGAEKICVIGELAEKPVFQGGGSSHIKPTHMDIPLDCLKAALPGVTYAPGYSAKGDAEKLRAEAVAAAGDSDKIVVFAGYFDTEGGDRDDMKLPQTHDALIAELCKLGKPVIVVLMCGAPVEMPWHDGVAAILQAYLGGQGVGSAIAALLTGAANPSGKLTETFPLRLEDTPAYLNYPGDGTDVHYNEDIYVGYRYYDAKNMAVRYPFGHGLSYTTFAYSNLNVSRDAIADTDALEVSFDVTNTGSVAGSEVAQLYVAKKGGKVPHPVKELKGFARVELQPGETKTVTLGLDRRSFAYWNEKAHDFVTENGEYGLLAGASSRDIRLECRVNVTSTYIPRPVYDRNSCVGDIMRDPEAMKKVQPLFDVIMGGMGAAASGKDDNDDGMSLMVQKMMEFMPLRAFAMMSGGIFGEEQLAELIDTLNS